MKTAGFNTSVTSVIDYISFAKDACLMFALENFTSKFVEKTTVKKHYFTDNGLLSIFLSDGQTALLENLCAVFLYQKYGEKLYFYNKNIEVDFYIPDEDYGIQVSYSISDDTTRRRELSALEKLDGFMPMKRMVVITFDEEETVQLSNGKTIEVIPAWKWMLE
ncbi:MAG: ATP-binding protein [Bacteroidales bacterium]|nr:ATP-binding protein [Bacteroidales bacterium]